MAAIYQHPYYDDYLLDYDISILRLISPLPFGPTIAPAPLPEFNQPIIAGSISEISGWGILADGTNPSQLQVVEVPIISLEECKAANGDEFVTDRMFCAVFPEGGKDACKVRFLGKVAIFYKLKCEHLIYKGNTFCFLFCSFNH